MQLCVNLLVKLTTTTTLYTIIIKAVLTQAGEQMLASLWWPPANIFGIFTVIISKG